MMLSMISKKALLAAACAAMAGVGVQAATLTWTGGGDGTSFDDEANWSGTATGGTIDTNALIDEYVVGAGAAIDTSSARLNFIDNGAGGVGTLTMSGGTLNTLPGGTSGIGLLETPDSFGVMNLTGGTVSTQFLAEMIVTLGGTGEIVLNGGGNPVNISTIDFTSTTSSVHFLAEDTAAFTAEHLSKFTVNGNAAVIGTNLSVVSDGGTGVIVSAVPEPGSLALLGLGGLAVLRRRRG